MVSLETLNNSANWVVVANLLVARYKHCPNCGQAIDWSVEE